MTRTELDTCLGLLGTANETIKSVGEYVNIQLMGNADITQTSIDTIFSEAPQAKREQYKQLIELIVKKPFRRQYGRLRSIARSLAEVEKLLSKEHAALPVSTVN